MAEKSKAKRTSQGGQAFIEYIVVLMLGVMVLTSGDPSALTMLKNAIQGYYTDYTFAVSISGMPDCTQSWSALGNTATADQCPDASSPTWPVKFN